MPISEFEIIKKYFADSSSESQTAAYSRTHHVKHGIGDDGAVLHCPPEHELIVSTDILNEGVHFYKKSTPYYIGYKSLVVNLSDLAAMGATPYWFTLNLSLSQIDETWLEDFAQGLKACANEHDITLVGGDTTRGSLSIGVQVGGYVPRGQAILRSGAMPGDRIFVSGALGQAAYINYRLNESGEDYDVKLEPYLTPVAQIPLGVALRNIANAGIDVSDGLIADLSHITTASHCGATLYADKIPVAENLFMSDLSDMKKLELACTGGEDYVLCFTVAEHKLSALLNAEIADNITEIGVIDNSDNVCVLDARGHKVGFTSSGYEHFNTGK